MGNQLTIRRAKKGDAESILRLTKSAFSMYSDALGNPSIPVYALSETLNDTLSDIENGNVFAAEFGGVIAGAIRYEKLSDEVAYIYRFAVDPSVNNTGIGSGLLEYCLADISGCGFKAVALHTNAKYYKLARYYYGKEFYVHSTSDKKGYIRALFIKELSGEPFDLSPAFLK